MARQKKTPTPVEEIVLDQDKVNAATEAMRQELKGRELAVSQRDATVRTLAQQLRYEGSTDPATLENSAREAIRRIGMGIFELGGYLLLLREACPHGQFLPTLERLGMGPDAAQRYMAVTRRFAANAATSRHLESAGMSRLVELLPLDDEQLEDLTTLGQTGELKLDDVASMSVKELRAAVREAKQDSAAKDELLANKNKQIDKLQADKRRIARATPDEKLAELKKEAAMAGFEATAAVVGNLRLALQALRDHDEEAGTPDASTLFMATLVGEVRLETQKLLDAYVLPDISNAADLELQREVQQWAGKPDGQG